MTLLPEDKDDFITLCYQDAIDRIAACKALSWQVLRWAVTLILIALGFYYAVKELHMLVIVVPVALWMVCLVFLTSIGAELNAHRTTLNTLRDRIGGTVKALYDGKKLTGTEVALSAQALTVLVFPVGATLLLLANHWSDVTALQGGR